MNTARKSLMLSMSCLLLAACASTGDTAQARSSGWERDEGYISAVERVAKINGAQVHWVNPPYRRKDD
ncbi:MAG: hypothetical protein ABS41_06325 [Arenimonas sp. SCN 70-307]|uniref:hypothetical protein n=1 Tax=Arenimonas sp. SCN 70-307 TaxID=1660089 RepID=UPI000868CF99|nr:hypothetical protein [Arenimonas sp. SCN 70-307]ODS62797.1 MAG: hypothetical protein ABS41_06325 [Arenimonas sp. SCN 70-307]